MTVVSSRVSLAEGRLYLRGHQICCPVKARYLDYLGQHDGPTPDHEDSQIDLPQTIIYGVGAVTGCYQSPPGNA